MVKEKGYVNSYIIAHSSDDDKKSVGILMAAGSELFERKPTSQKKMIRIVKDHIDINENLAFFEE